MTTTVAPPAGASNKMWTSIWGSVVRDRYGRIKHVTPEHVNLRVNSGADWQMAAMEGSSNKGESGTATASSATTLTATAAFPTTAIVTGATGGYAGHIVAVGPNSAGTGSTVYGVILSNTATVLTVDRWVDAGTPFAAGTTPNATAKFQILPGMAPQWFMALSSTVQSGAAGDVILAGELTTGGFARTNYTTLTHTLASATYTLANTFTASATQTINSEALMGASGTAGVATAANSGVMSFESAEPSPPTLVSADTLAQSVQISAVHKNMMRLNGRFDDDDGFNRRGPLDRLC